MKFHTFTKIIILLSFLLLINAQSWSVDYQYWIPNGSVYTVDFDDNHLYISGDYNYIGPNTGYSAIVSKSPADKTIKFPAINGMIHHVINDKNGGWYILGDFNKINNIKTSNLARILVDGQLDKNWLPDVISSNTRFMVETKQYILVELGIYKREMLLIDKKNDKAKIKLSYDEMEYLNSVTSDDSCFYLQGKLYGDDHQLSRKFIKIKIQNSKIDTLWVKKEDEIYEDIKYSDNYIYVSLNKQIKKISCSTGIMDSSWKYNLPYNSGVYDSFIINKNYIYIPEGIYENQKYKYSIKRYDINSLIEDKGWQVNLDYQPSVYSVDEDFIYVAGQISEYISSVGYLNRFDLQNPEYKTTYNITHPNTPAFCQGSKKILIYSDFPSFNGIYRKSMLRLNHVDGLVDKKWVPDNDQKIFKMLIDNDNIYALSPIVIPESLIVKSAKVSIISKSTGKTIKEWVMQGWSYSSKIIMKDEFVYITGQFNRVGEFNTKNIARINRFKNEIDTTFGKNLQGLGLIQTINFNDKYMYLGGSFYLKVKNSHCDVIRINYVTEEIDTSWCNSHYGHGPIESISFSDSSVYLGGNFIRMGNFTRNKLAKLDKITGNVDSLWDPDADYGHVYDLFYYKNNIYVAGDILKIAGYAFPGGFVKIDNIKGQIDKFWIPNLGYCYSIITHGNKLAVVGGFNNVFNYYISNFCIFTDTEPTDISGAQKKGKSLLSAKNYPNPSNSTSIIEYFLPSSGEVTIMLTDILGRKTILQDKVIQGEGNHKFYVDFGKLNLSSGVYFYKIIFNETSQSGKIIYLK